MSKRAGYPVAQRGPCAMTNEGKLYYPLSPRVDDISPGVVAHALNQIVRYNGHTQKGSITVLRHSFIVKKLVWFLADETLPPSVALAALWHDAHEAFLGDITAPVKRAIASMVSKRSVAAPSRVDPIADLVFDWDVAIADYLGINPSGFTHNLVKRADRIALLIESRRLFPDADWRPFLTSVSATTDDIATALELEGGFEEELTGEKKSVPQNWTSAFVNETEKLRKENEF